jgi:hypothetical protein
VLRSIYRYFDRLEDRVRGRLSHYPIVYALLGGVGVVLFWRGVWHTTDVITRLFLLRGYRPTAFDLLDGPLSFVASCVLLLMTGLFVSSFLSGRILTSGLKHEERVSEKTEVKVIEEATELERVEAELEKIEHTIQDIKEDVEERK